MWQLVSQTPESFRGGDIWRVITGINGALQGVGYGLLILFFAMGVFQTAASFRELQRPEFALRHFIRFAGAKVVPLWLVAFVGSLIVTVLSFILILTVYGRFFRLYLYTALAPVPLASFAGEGTASTGRAFIKSYIVVCMEGAVIVLACLIYSAFLSSSSPAVDSSLQAVTMAWQYIGQLVFNMLVLTGLVKGADRIAREMIGH